MRVQHNIPAMNAYRNYTNNVRAVAKNLEKLSSGYRINRAGDDAAGLAISEKMRAQITGLKTAQKNAKDGISLVQTAEGALTEVHSMLNRMFELAEQSANGTYDNEVDRANLQKEFNALRTEIDRIADSSNFNGKKLLDGSLDSTVAATFTKTANAAILPYDANAVYDTNTILHSDQKAAVASSFAVDVGNLILSNASNSDDSTAVTLNIGSLSFDLGFDIGQETSLSNADLITNLKNWAASPVADDTDNTLTFDVSVSDDGIISFTQTGGDHVDVNQAVSFSATDGAFSADTYNATTGTTTTYNQNTIKNVAGKDATVDVRANTKFDLTAAMVKDGGTITIGDTTYVFAIGEESAFQDQANVIDMTHMATDAAPADLLKEAGTLLSQQDNAMATIGFNGTATISLEEKANQKVADLTTYAGFENAVSYGAVTLGVASGSALTLQIGDTADGYNMLSVSVQDMHAEALGLGNNININEQGMSQTTMDAIKNAINSVSSTRGDLGALQNRLEHTINNLGVMQENIQDAESTIRDTDIAEEMMAYTKNNILVQSAQAMLAQANQLPQGVLQLLG